MNPAYFSIGRIIKAHGIQGHVKIKMDVDDIRSYLKKKQFFIQKHGQFHAFVVSKITLSSTNELIVKFVDINDRNLSESYIGTEVFSPVDELKPLVGDTKFYYHEILGAVIVDNILGELGTISAVYEAPAQDVIAFNHLNKEILFPIIDDFILKFDRTENKLYTNLPEGLLDVYLIDSKQSDEE